MAERAVFYARVSTEEEQQVNALAKQIQENRDVIRAKGWELIDEYIDEGKSGTKIKGRNEYQRLLEDLERDVFDIIVIKDQERLMRNVRDWYNFLDRLVQNGKKLYMYLEGKYYSTDDALITGIKAIIAEEYSRNLSKKLNNANKRRIERALRGEEVSAMGNGKSLAFKIIDGKWVKDEEEAKLGKLIFELYLQYDSIRKVRDEVNNRGYRNSVGKPFTSESISRILKNEKAKGIIVIGKHHHDFDQKKIVKRPEEEWVRIEDKSLAYVTDEIFDEVQRRLKSKTGKDKSGKSRGIHTGTEALSGKLFCGCCGKKLWKHQSNGYYSWYCSSKMSKGNIACKGVGITTVAVRRLYKELTRDLEINKKAVKNEILQWLKQLKATLSDTSTNERLQKEVEKLEAQRAKLLDAYLEELISKDDYKAKFNELELMIEEKKKLLQPLDENEDIIAIEEVINNIDAEIEEYIRTLAIEESKIDFLIEHTQRITVLENKDIVIEMDLIAGAIIAGEDFLLYVHDTMSFANG